MTNAELIAYLKGKPPGDMVAFHEPGTSLYTPITPHNIVLFERLSNTWSCNLWNDGRGAFTLEERRNYLHKSRGWRGINEL